MFIFLIISAAIVVILHKTTMKAVNEYNYGHGSYEEWREFERQFQHDELVKF